MNDEQSKDNNEQAENAVAKSKNQIKNEAKRAEKLAKFQAKQEKLKIEKKETCSSNSKSSMGKAYTVDNNVESIETTPEGQKKDVSKPMSNAYNPKAVESGWYSWWESQGFFKPEAILQSNPTAPVYVISIPPPNITGSLHLGHAMATSVEDALIRWKRMKGHAALYVPGCDHAGISCQVVVEKHLKKSRNLTRHDLGRENFVNEIWKWKNQYGDRIYSQFKRLGGSMDWDRVKFTLDADMAHAVAVTFIKFFEEDVIYRANRLVNWSAKLQTAVSDLEVDHKHISGTIRLPAHGHDPKKTYEFGTLYYAAYRLYGEGDQEIVVATTRPETIPGDVAVAVHPLDPKYFTFHGKYLMHPIHKTKVPVVLDDSVEITFGTGAVKITPAHDVNDFEVAQRHGLPMVNIMDDFNRLNENAGQFKGLMRFDAREAIIQYLKDEGLFRDSKSHEMQLPICNRSGDIIEPKLKPQWWLRCDDLAKKAAEVVNEGKLKLIPEENNKVWLHWMNNCRDWCLSRQLWWGHRVPAYSVQLKESTNDGECWNHVLWVAAEDSETAMNKAKKALPEALESHLRLEQDPDVLDTWFSSGLWPFATLGWPKATPDFSKYYPTSVLETGRDIIFFWVARMVMFGLHLTGQLPFKTVYFHSIIRDAHGIKMSKSLGNVIDPIDVIEGVTLETLHERLEYGNLDPAEISRAKETQKRDFPNGIKECGTDALRFALCSYTSQGSDINLDILRVEGYRRFCNKLWNAVKFASMKFGIDFVPTTRFELCGKESLYDRWILFRLNNAIKEININFEEFQFMKVTSAIHNFILYDLCDVYIEAVKPIMTDTSSDESSTIAKNILYTAIEIGLQCLHPFMPFITEELYQRLPRRPKDSIATISLTKFPEERKEWDALKPMEDQVLYLQSIVHETRSLANNHQLKGPMELILMISEEKRHERQLIETQTLALQSLIKGLSKISIREHDSKATIIGSLPDSTKISLSLL